MKVILCDALVQQPSDPFQFVADRLRAVDPEAGRRKAKGKAKKKVGAHRKDAHGADPAALISHEIKNLKRQTKRRGGECNRLRFSCATMDLIVSRLQRLCAYLRSCDHQDGQALCVATISTSN